MALVEVWAMYLPDRISYTKQGGNKISRARTLFIGLLPNNDTCYTADEIVKRALPKKDDYVLRVDHRRKLDSLARKHGLSVGSYPGPDNVDPTGALLPGKRSGTQPCRWKRETWLKETVSDEAYQWLQALNRRIVDHIDSCFVLYGRKVQVFVDLDCFELTEKLGALVTDDFRPCWDITDKTAVIAAHPSWPTRPAPPDRHDSEELDALQQHQYTQWKKQVSEERTAAEAALTKQNVELETQVAFENNAAAMDQTAERGAHESRDSSGKVVSRKCRKFRFGQPTFAALTAVAALLLLWVWPMQKSPPHVFPGQRTIEVDFIDGIEPDEYLARRKNEAIIFSEPLSDEAIATKWKEAENCSPSMLAMIPPPPLFESATRHHHPVEVGHL